MMFIIMQTSLFMGYGQNNKVATWDNQSLSSMRTVDFAMLGIALLVKHMLLMFSIDSANPQGINDVQRCLLATKVTVCLTSFKWLTWCLPGIIHMRPAKLLPAAAVSSCVLLLHIIFCQRSAWHFGRCADCVVYLRCARM